MEEKRYETAPGTNETVKPENNSKGRLSKGKTALIIIVAILYTVVVSLTSSVITKNVIEYKDNKIAQEMAEEEKERREKETTGSNKVEVVMGDDKETDMNNDKPLRGDYEDKNEGPSVGKPDKNTIALNKAITVGDVMEITFTSWEWCDEILPANSTSGYYSYYDDKSGEKYIVIKGTVKNISPKEYALDDVVDMVATVNNKYEISATTASIESSDGTGFSSYEDIKSLQTLDFVIFASYADGVYDEYENIKFEFELFNNSDKIGEYFYNENEKPVDKYSLTVSKS